MHSTWLGAVCGVTFGLISTSASAQTPRVLARAAFVRAVLAANPSIESARQGWRAALARVRQAGAFDDPMIDVSAAPLSIGSSHARFGYEVGIRQQLPWFGKRALERDVMVAEAAASASDLETTRRELAMTAVLLYDDYYVTSRSLEINAQHVALLQSLRDAATAQLETGRGSAHDALQAEAELTHLERDAAMLEADRDVVSAQMNEVLHRRSDAPLPPPVRELGARDEPPRTNTKQLEQDAIAHRSEIAAARSHARAQAAKAQAAAREQYPSLSVSTSYSSMWDMPEHRWMVGIGLNVPWPTEQRAGAIDEAHAARAQYQSEVERMSDAARTQVYVALRRLRESERVLELFSTRLLPVAQQQVDAAQAGFTTSQTAFVMVIDAEKNLRSAELDHMRTQAEHDRRCAELERALGHTPGLGDEGSKR